jgi:hypothetical protein
MKIQISQGLLEHYEKMKESVWLFMWLIDKQTSEEGEVLFGEPINYNTVAKDIPGLTHITYRRWVNKLKAEKYITLKRNPYGYIFTINNPKKMFKRVIKNDLSDTPDSTKMSDPDGSKMSTRPIKNERSHILHEINLKYIPPKSPKGDEKKIAVRKTLPVRRNERKVSVPDPAYLERLSDLVNRWNNARGNRFKATESLHVNFSYWAGVYTQEEMLQAVENITLDEYWDKIMTPEMFLRRKNPRGEAVDYIGKFYNLKKPKVHSEYMTVEEAKVKGVLW